MPKVENWDDPIQYDPVFSWRNAMDKAQEIMDRSMTPSSTRVDAAQVMYDVACIQLWVQIALVHATNANTEVLKAWNGTSSRH